MAAAIVLGFSVAAVMVGSCAAVTIVSETGWRPSLPALPRLRLPSLPRLPRPRLPRLSYRRNGGLRFVRFGRLNLTISFARR